MRNDGITGPSLRSERVIFYLPPLAGEGGAQRRMGGAATEMVLAIERRRGCHNPHPPQVLRRKASKYRNGHLPPQAGEGKESQTLRTTRPPIGRRQTPPAGCGPAIEPRLFRIRINLDIYRIYTGVKFLHTAAVTLNSISNLLIDLIFIRFCRSLTTDKKVYQ